MTTFMLTGGRPAPTKRDWRRDFAGVRTALREAEALRGKARTAALVKVCELMMDATADPPVPWRKGAGGTWWRVRDARTRLYDTAEKRLELRVSRAVGGRCPCCWMDEHEDRQRPRKKG
jgi:hypothetical protein